MTQIAHEPHGETARRLVDAGVEIARDRGLAALTARALADHAGLSPSALNYHLGGRDVLVGLVLERTLAASAAWRAERLAATGEEAGAPSWVSPAGAIAAALSDRVDNFRCWSLLLAEFEAQAELDPAIRDAVGGQVAAMAEFWCAVATKLGEAPEAAAIWADLALGLTRLFLGDEPAAAKLPWIVDATGRLKARLGRAPITPLAERAAGPAERLNAKTYASDGARRLLDAALKVLAEKGADRLTQREVAATAGLSLAATTYFFGTKAELIAAAFNELHRQVGDQARALATANPDEVTLAHVALEEGGEGAVWRLRAMEALVLASARDSSLAPLARNMRATRGATSIGWLRSLGVEADRLDAFVFSTAMSGVIQRTRFSATGRRAAAMVEGERRLLGAAFGL
jgi:AcrR family transcriptional regulator